MKRLTFILLFTLISAATFAQSKGEGPLVQFTGVVISMGNKTVIPYATVTNISHQNQVNIANYKGYFSFVAHERDSIKVTSIGYGSTVVVIPSNIKDHSYTLQIFLNQQSVNLPVVRIFPWATTDEFKKDFMTMKIADDDLEIARKNLEGRSIASLRHTLPRDNQEIQNAWSQDEHNTIINQHQLLPNPLFNPFAWGSLIKEISDGNKARGVTDN